MENCNCIKCQGVLTSPYCVEINSEKFCNLDEFSTSVEASLKVLETPHAIDIKSLSTLQVISRDQIIQILINEIISLKAVLSTPLSNNNICTSLNWSSVTNCNNCPSDFCSQQQNLINVVGILKEQANV